VSSSEIKRLQKQLKILREQVRTNINNNVVWQYIN